jgi:hypothetical protein
MRLVYMTDIQQAGRNPRHTAITIGHACTGYGCRHCSGMIVFFCFALTRPSSWSGPDDIPHHISHDRLPI